MMVKVFISGQFPEYWLDKFNHEFSVDYYDSVASGGTLDREELLERLQGTHVFITELDTVDSALIEKAPQLLAVVSLRGNPVNVDIEAASEHNIVVFNTPARNADAVADFTIMLMIMTARNVAQAMEALRRNEWVEHGRVDNYYRHMGYELGRKTVGLIGFGAIGRKVARRLQGFDAKVLVYDPYVSVPDERVEFVTLGTLLQNSDFVSLHAPVTPQTKNMIGAREFAHMKESAYFINTARADLVDEQALIDVLKRHKIAGAGIDVFPDEPIPSDYPLLQLDNVVATPHLGGASHDVSYHHAQMAYESLKGLANDKLINVVNRDVFPHASRSFLQVKALK